MKPDLSQWRNNHTYAFLGELPTAGLAWECARRNETYQRFYRGLVMTASEADPLPADAVNRWGLRFRRQAELVRFRTTNILVTAR